MTTLSYSYARQNLKSIFDMATKNLEEVFISRRNGENVVVLSEEEFLGWKETIHLMKNPHNAEHINKSLDQLEKGETTTFDIKDL